MNGVHLIFERRLREERSQTYPYLLNSEQGSIWHQNKVFGMTRSVIEHTNSRTRGERYTHWATWAEKHGLR